jgi:hypothetical protein
MENADKLFAWLPIHLDQLTNCNEGEFFDVNLALRL